MNVILYLWHFSALIFIRLLCTTIIVQSGTLCTLYSVHRLYNIHRSTFTVHILSHTFVRSTYKKQIKLLKRDILIACIDDILTFSAPIMTLGLFSPSIYFLLSLTLTLLLLENGFFKSKAKKQTIFAFCSSLSHELEFPAHIAYFKRKRKREKHTGWLQVYQIIKREKRYDEWLPITIW